MPTTSPTLRSQLQRTGIRRTGGPRNGFRYRLANGAAASTRVREWIERLRIPPGWRDVSIAPRAGARLQAVGLDAAGRWQYLYRADHTVRRARRKYDRLVAFARALPALRAMLRRDLARPGMPLERACAASVLLLAAAALRPGADQYARDNGTRGLATLQPRHVSVRGNIVRLAYRGKHGVRQEHVLRGARLARLVREMLRMPGRELLKHRDAAGHVHDLRREQLNAYVKHAMGSRFTAKDFRTWCATLMCAGALRELAAKRRPRFKADPSEREVMLRKAIGETAEWLGNTPGVTRESYVHPELLEAFREGRVLARAIGRPELLVERIPRGLHPAELALVRLIAARGAGASARSRQDAKVRYGRD
jgi:DNA topoisomerase-1